MLNGRIYIFFNLKHEKYTNVKKNVLWSLNLQPLYCSCNNYSLSQKYHAWTKNYLFYMYAMH
jgi:hypothetical protein